MAEINILYNKPTNSWWINKDMDGFTLRNYIAENPISLGTVEFNTDKSEVTDLYEIESAFIPNYIKILSGISSEIEENGLKNTIKITDEQIKDFLT